MIRIICTETDFGDAANIGGPVIVRHKTFDIDAPEVEEWLRFPAEELKRLRAAYPSNNIWISRFTHGVELIDPPEESS